MAVPTRHRQVLGRLATRTRTVLQTPPPKSRPRPGCGQVSSKTLAKFAWMSLHQISTIPPRHLPLMIQMSSRGAQEDLGPTPFGLLVDRTLRFSAGPRDFPGASLAHQGQHSRGPRLHSTGSTCTPGASFAACPPSHSPSHLLKVRMLELDASCSW